jgi:serine/threonine protein kinase
LVKNDFRATVLVQERAPYGNLQILLQNNQFKPSGSVLIKIFLQIIDALIYMIDQMIIYGDLRCENVLVFQMNPLQPEENLIKLTNFNLVHHNNSSSKDNRQIMIPIRYCAPEILRSKDRSNYSELSDVYSMGILMWEAYSKGNLPYGSNMNDNDVRQCILNGEKLSKPKECIDQIWNIIQDCWYKEPEVRYNFKEIQSLLSNICIT